MSETLPDGTPAATSAETLAGMPAGVPAGTSAQAPAAASAEAPAPASAEFFGQFPARTPTETSAAALAQTPTGVSPATPTSPRAEISAESAAQTPAETFAKALAGTPAEAFANMLASIPPEIFAKALAGIPAETLTKASAETSAKTLAAASTEVSDASAAASADITPDELRRASAWLQALRAEIGKAVVGQTEVIDQTLTALAAAGHVIIEGVPGLGKTLLVRALAQALQLRYARVQFTPDLMPTDITGHAVLDPSAPGERGLGALRVHQGPVFTHLLLADEINRAPAKTQSALLEVMQEYQVTLEGQELPMPQPFMVLATQNPVDTEGTYPLPEAQMDRFLLKIDIGYPTHAEEHAIVQRTTGQRAGNQLPLEAVRALLSGEQVLELQRLAARVRADAQVIDYAVSIVRATRTWPGLSAGAGPRGAVALVRAARAAALLAGRDFITPDDVARQSLPALRHRVQMSPDAQLEGTSVDDLLRAARDSVQAPRL